MGGNPEATEPAIRTSFENPSYAGREPSETPPPEEAAKEEENPPAKPARKGQEPPPEKPPSTVWQFRKPQGHEETTEGKSHHVIASPKLHTGTENPSSSSAAKILLPKVLSSEVTCTQEHCHTGNRKHIQKLNGDSVRLLPQLVAHGVHALTIQSPSGEVAPTPLAEELSRSSGLAGARTTGGATRDEAMGTGSLRPGLTGR